MPDLYTSLTRLKMTINGGELPALTPLRSREAREFIDPKFTMSLDRHGAVGGLFEDAQRGLMCPVRGCGQFHHFLSRHIRRCHGAIGGVAAVRVALEIPTRVALLSRSAKLTLSAAQAARPRRPRKKSAYKVQYAFRGGRKNGRLDFNKTEMAARKARATRNKAGYRNLWDSCEAQLISKVLLPGGVVAPEQSIPYKLRRRIKTLYGEWSIFVGVLRMRSGLAPGKECRNTILDCFESYARWSYPMAGRGVLPSATEVHLGGLRPYIPDPELILKCFKAKTIEAALVAISAETGIPESSASVAA